MKLEVGRLVQLSITEECFETCVGQGVAFHDKEENRKNGRNMNLCTVMSILDGGRHEVRFYDGYIAYIPSECLLRPNYDFFCHNSSEYFWRANRLSMKENSIFPAITLPSGAVIMGGNISSTPHKNPAVTIYLKTSDVDKSKVTFDEVLDECKDEIGLLPMVVYGANDLTGAVSMDDPKSVLKFDNASMESL